MFNRSNSQMFWGGVFDGITLGLGRLKSSLQRMYIYDEDYDEIDDALVRKIETAFNLNDTMSINILCSVLEKNGYEIVRVTSSGSSDIWKWIYIQEIGRGEEEACSDCSGGGEMEPQYLFSSPGGTPVILTEEE